MRYFDVAVVGCSACAMTCESQNTSVPEIYVYKKLMVIMVLHVIPHDLSAGPHSKLVRSCRWLEKAIMISMHNISYVTYPEHPAMAQSLS